MHQSRVALKKDGWLNRAVSRVEPVQLRVYDTKDAPNRYAKPMAKFGERFVVPSRF